MHPTHWQTLDLTERKHIYVMNVYLSELLLHIEFLGETRHFQEDLFHLTKSITLLYSNRSKNK